MWYRTVHMIRHVIPDERLAHVTIGDSGGDALITFAYRAWRIHPALVREMDALSRSVAEVGVYEFEPLGAAHRLDVWVQAVRPEYVPPGHAMAAWATPDGWELRVRSDMIEPAMIPELNEIVLPTVCGLLVPTGLAPAP